MFSDLQAKPVRKIIRTSTQGGPMSIERGPNQSLTFDTVDQQIRLHALNVAVASRQAVGRERDNPAADFADVVLQDAAKYEAFLRGSEASNAG